MGKKENESYMTVNFNGKPQWLVSTNQKPKHESTENGWEKTSPVVPDGEVNGCDFNAEQYTCRWRDFFNERLVSVHNENESFDYLR